MSDKDFYSAAYDAAEADCKALRAENDRLRQALTAIVENAEMEYFGAYGVEPEFIDAARAELAKEAGQ